MIVFDVGDSQSFEKAKDWLSRLRKELNDPTMPIAVAANKCDGDSRAVSSSEAADFAKENGLELFETSAKNGSNVEEMFLWIAKNLPDADVPTEPSVAAAGLNVSSGGGGMESNCC